MPWEMIAIVVTALATFVLFIYCVTDLPSDIRALVQRYKHIPHLDYLLRQGNPLTDENILDLLRLIRKLDSSAALRAKEGVKWYPARAIRPLALKVLEEITELPARDFWTLPVLTELAGHPIPPESAAKILRHFEKIADQQHECTPALVHIGTAEAGKLLVNSIESDEWKRGLAYISRSLETAFDLNQMDTGFREALAAFFSARAERDPYSFSGHDAKLWLLVAPERATERLTRRPFWTSRHAREEILWGLRGISARVPENRLLSLEKLLKKVTRPNRRPPLPHFLIVWLLARIKSPHALPLIDQLKGESDYPPLIEEASSAEAAFSGILQPERIIERCIARDGFAASPPVFRHLWALKYLLLYISRTNLSDYFLSKHGDHWADALIGLDKAGFVKSAIAFREVIALFGQEGPPVVHQTRVTAVENLSGITFTDLNRLEAVLYQLKHEGSQWHYIMANADFFREPQPDTLQS